MTLQLVEITNTDDHVLKSYRFLEKRMFSISHGSMPSFEEHADFVANNPYRFWFFIKSDDDYLGTIYLQHDNSIGVNLQPFHLPLIPEVLAIVTQLCNPLPAVPSVRRGQFFLNISPADLELQKTLQEMGAYEIQRSFALPDM